MDGRLGEPQATSSAIVTTRLATTRRTTTTTALWDSRTTPEPGRLMCRGILETTTGNSFSTAQCFPIRAVVLLHRRQCRRFILEWCPTRLHPYCRHHRRHHPNLRLRGGGVMATRRVTGIEGYRSSKTEWEKKNTLRRHPMLHLAAFARPTRDTMRLPRCRLRTRALETRQPPTTPRNVRAWQRARCAARAAQAFATRPAPSITLRVMWQASCGPRAFTRKFTASRRLNRARIFRRS